MQLAKKRLTRARRGFTLVELLVVIAIIGILVALLLPAVQAAREASRRARCQNNVKQLCLGIQLFHDSHKEFPAAIEPGYTEDPDPDFRHSHVPYILPYIEEQPLHDLYRFDRHWDDAETNRNITGRIPATAVDIPLLICPSTPQEVAARNDYGAVVGPGGIDNDGDGQTDEGWCKGENWSLGVLIAVPAPCPPNHRKNPNAVNRRIKVSQITDGTTYTVLLGECAGRDVNLNHAGGQKPSVTLFWANGDHAYAHHREAVNIDPVDELYSDHPGGLHLGMADASVRFFNESISKWVIDAFSTRAGGELFHGEL